MNYAKVRWKKKLCKIFCNRHKCHIANLLLLEYHTKHVSPPPRGILLTSSDRDDRIGAKIKTQKKRSRAGVCCFAQFFCLFPQLWWLVPGYLSKHGKESQLWVFTCIPADSANVECDQCQTMQGKTLKNFSVESFYHKVQKLANFLGSRYWVFLQKPKEW